MSGQFVGSQVGPRAGPGVGAPRGGDSLASVARDLASGWYLPSSAAQWNTLRSVAGLPAGAPGSTRLCQDASPGPLDDAIGAVDLAASGAGHLYQVPVVGFTRTAQVTVDGTVGQKWLNSTTAPDPNATSTLMLVVIGFGAVAPLANRCLFANSGTLDCRLAVTTGRVAIVNGATTTGTVAYTTGGVHVLLLQRNITAGTFTLYSDLEKIVGTFGAVASNPMMALGGQTAAAAGVGYLYESEFSGAAAEITSAQAKSLIATMTGVTPPWAP